MEPASKTSGVTLTTDGMTYLKRPFVNIVLVHPCEGSLPFKVIDCSDQLCEDTGGKDASWVTSRALAHWPLMPDLNPHPELTINPTVTSPLDH